MLSIDTVQTAFQQEYGIDSRPEYCFFSPGRVNLIGEHIDYNGGYVFPAALTLGIYGAVRRRPDMLVVLKSANAALTVTVDLRAPIENCVRAGWANYPKGVIKHLLENGHILTGCDILFYGNLPDGTGLSSSAALLVLTGYMLRTINGETDINKVELAKVCQRIENQFIGVNCGIMDQFAVALGRKDCAILLDCQTLAYKYIPFMLDNYSLVIMNTNKKREVAESKYNERRSECEQALIILNRQRKIEHLCQATLAEVDSYLDDPVLRRRARHVIAENTRVLGAVDLLTQRDITGFADLMTQSHRSLQVDYEVSGPELDAIVEAALQSPGCIGSRMTGAGFGGCAIALVETVRLTEFKVAAADSYQVRTGRPADFYVAGIADGVSRVAGCER
ncbi:galactokinase [Sporomusa aerivorans]|uniref:galactokinase n=1 Tax=Sporomusa aerivorans TaxID=204936 RepID=UPI00352AC5D8